MTLLGTLIDKIPGTVGTAGGGAVYSMLTYSHSLGTTPDIVIPVFASIESIAALNAVNNFSPGGNASIATVGIRIPSVATSPAASWNALAIYFHSIIR